MNYKTYLLADSHGVELGQLPEQYGVFNFSAVSDSYFDMLFKIRYLVRNTDVKKIIISVDDHAFSKYREYTNNTDRSIFFESRHDCDNRYNYFRDRYIKRYIVLINSKSRDIVKLFLKSKLLESNQKPPVKIWATLSPEEQKDLSLIRYKYQFPSQTPSKLMPPALEEIIQACKENNIEIIGIKFPLSNAFVKTIEHIDFNANELLQMHHIKIFDYKEIYIDQDQYFLDQDHLNKTGVTEFLKILYQEVF